MHTHKYKVGMHEMFKESQMRSSGQYQVLGRSGDRDGMVVLGFVVGRCHCSGPAQLSLRRSGGWGGRGSVEGEWRS